MRKPKKTVILLSFVVIILIGLKIAGGRALRYGLEKGFAKGTGCIVSVESASVNFFPLRGKAKNLKLYHPSEGSNAGISIAQASVKLDFFSLLTKRVILRNLSLRGTSIVFEQPASGLPLVLEFLFKPRTSTPRALRPWHALFSHGWKVSVPDLLIATYPSANTPVRIATDNVSLFSAATQFSLVNDISSPAPPQVALKARHLRIGNEGLLVPLGDLSAEGTIGNGVITLSEAFLRPPAHKSQHGQGISDVSGTIKLKDAGQYALTVRSQLRGDYLAGLLPSESEVISILEPAITLSAELSGELTEPQVIGDIAVEINDKLPLIKRTNCALTNFSSKFNLTRERLRLTDTDIDELLSFADITFHFDPQISFEGDLTLAINKDKAAIRRCLSSIQDESKVVLASAVLEDAVLNSVSQLNLSGSLTPLTLDGSLAYTAHIGDQTAQSSLNATFKFEGNKLSLEAKEQGTNQQIQGIATTTDGSTDTQAPRTAFQTAFNSIINFALEYDFESGRLDLPEIEVLRYPAGRLLARVAPFVPQEVFGAIEEVVSSETLFNLDMRLRRNSAEEPVLGSGKWYLSSIDLAVLETPLLSLTTNFTAEGMQFKDITLITEGGFLAGNAAVKNKQVSGKLYVQDFDLRAFHGLRDSLSRQEARASGELLLSGAVDNVNYSMEGTAHINPISNQERMINSQVQVNGDFHSLTLTATIVNKRGNIELYFPFSPATGEQLRLRADLNELPLELFVPDTSDNDLEVQLVEDNALDTDYQGVLDARLNFEGPTDNLLLGAGELVIPRFRLKSRGIEVLNEHELKASIEGGRLNLENFSLLSQDKRIGISGYVDHDAGWFLDVDGTWDLRGLVLHFPGLEQVVGDVTAHLAVRGPLNEPTVEGPISLEDGGISFPYGESVIGATNLVIDAEFNEDILEILKISADIGEGTVDGYGELNSAFDADARTLQLSFDFDDITIQPLQNLTTQFSGNLSVVKNPQRPILLEGLIEVDKAVYDETLTLQYVIQTLRNRLTGSRAADTRKIENQAENAVDLNIQVNASDSVLVETTFLEAELQGSLLVRGTTNEPLLSGTTEVTNGSFGFRSSEFEIIEGRIIFVEQLERINPTLSIISETSLPTADGTAHEIQVSITGTVSDLQIEFSSNTGLRQDEIVALLDARGALENLVAVRSRRDGEMLTLLELLDPSSGLSLRERFSDVADISTVNIDSTVSSETGEIVPRIGLTRPVTTDVNLKLTSELGGEQLSIAALEYSLTPYLNLVTYWKNQSSTESDSSTGTIGIGLVYEKSFPGLHLFPIPTSRLGAE